MSCALVLHSAGESHNSDLDIPSNDASQLHDEELQVIQTYLDTLSFPSNTPEKYHVHLFKWANQILLSGKHLWRKDPAGHHQLVLFRSDRLYILREAHNCLGHKGVYPMWCNDQASPRLVGLYTNDHLKC